MGLVGGGDRFRTPCVNVRAVSGAPVFCGQENSCSIVVGYRGPVVRCSTSVSTCCSFRRLFAGVLGMLKAKCAVRGRSVLYGGSFLPPRGEGGSCLSGHCFRRFGKQVCASVSACLIVAKRMRESGFFSFSPQEFSAFVEGVAGMLKLFTGEKVETGLLGRGRVRVCVGEFLSVGFGRRAMDLGGVGTERRGLVVKRGGMRYVSLMSVSRIGFPSVVGPCGRIGVKLEFPISLLSFLRSAPDVSAVVCGRMVGVPSRQGRTGGLRNGGGGRGKVPSPTGSLYMRSVRQIRSSVTERKRVLMCTRCGVVLTNLSSVDGTVGCIRASLFSYNVVVGGRYFGRLRLFRYTLPKGTVGLGDCSGFLAASSTTVYLLFGRGLRMARGDPFLACFASERKLPIKVSVSKGRNRGGCAGGSGFFILNPDNSNGSFCIGSGMER